MAFDPDKYLSEDETVETEGFNPDAYLSESEEDQIAPEYVESTSSGETAYDFTQGLAQGGTFNFGDEIRAGLQAGILNPLDALITGQGAFGDEGFIESIQNLPDNYERALTTEREGFDESQQRSPVAFGAGEITGAVAPYLIPAAGAAKTLGTVGTAATAPARAITGLGKAAEIGKAGSLLGKVTGGAAMGAADIGLREAGESEADNVEDLALDTIKGVGTGVAFGGLTPVGLKAANATLKGIGKSLGIGGRALEDLIFSNSPISKGFKLGKERIAAFSGTTEEATKQRITDYVTNVAKQVEDDVSKVLNKNTAKISDIYTKQLDDVINKKGDIPVEFGNFLNKVKTEAGERIGELRKTASANGLQVNVKEVTEEFLKTIDDNIASLPDAQRDPLMKTLGAIRKSVQEVGENKDIAGKIKTTLSEEGAELKRTIEAASKNVDLDTMDPQLLDDILREGQRVNQKVNIGKNAKGDLITKITDDIKVESPGPINYKTLSPEELASMISGKKTAVLQTALKRNPDPVVQGALMDYRKALTNLENDLVEGIGKEKEVFSAIKTMLGQVGEGDLSKYADDVIPTSKMTKIVNDIVKVIDKGNMREIRAKLAPIERIKPGFTDDFVNNIQKISQLEKQLKSVADDPLAQADALLTIGQDDVTAKTLKDAQREIRRGETIRREVGEFSEDVTPEGDLLPEDRMRRFLRNLTSESTKTEELRRAKNAAELINLYNPKLGQNIQTEGKLIGEASKFIDAINAQGDSSLSAVSNVLGAIGSRFGRAANFAGFYLKEMNELLLQRPSVQKLFKDQLLAAGERGPQAVASTIYILNQNNEDFRNFYNDMQEKLSKYEERNVEDQ